MLLIAVLVAVAAGDARADSYVALGDSYSSGTGTGFYPLDPGCLRSPLAYPALIAADRPGTQLTFVACAGATTADVLAGQVGSLTTATRIVTITVGGNDAGFASVVTRCALPWPVRCDLSRARSTIRTLLPARLDAVYNAIRLRAPAATVIVLGYPRIFGGVDCSPLTFFTRSEMTRLNATADLLRDTIRGRALAAGLTFVDAIPAFTGHAVCASDAWLNGLSSPLWDSFHPGRAGQRLGYEPLVRAVIG